MLGSCSKKATKVLDRKKRDENLVVMSSEF